MAILLHKAGICINRNKNNVKKTTVLYDIVLLYRNSSMRHGIEPTLKQSQVVCALLAKVIKEPYPIIYQGFPSSRQANCSQSETTRSNAALNVLRSNLFTELQLNCCACGQDNRKIHIYNRIVPYSAIAIVMTRFLHIRTLCVFSFRCSWTGGLHTVTYYSLSIRVSEACFFFVIMSIFNHFFVRVRYLCSLVGITKNAEPYR